MNKNKIKRDIELLDTCIEKKWKPRVKHGKFETMDCALCHEYAIYHCTNCPIYEDTNRRLCAGTVFYQNGPQHGLSSENKDKDAELMLEYLQSLKKKLQDSINQE